MKLIHLLFFSPAARAAGALMTGVYLVVHWKWRFQTYSRLSRAEEWQRNTPFELYTGLFLIVVGLVGLGFAYWLHKQPLGKTSGQPA